MTTLDRTRVDASKPLASAVDALGASADHWTIDPQASTFDLQQFIDFLRQERRSRRSISTPNSGSPRTTSPSPVTTQLPPQDE